MLVYYTNQRRIIPQTIGVLGPVNRELVHEVADRKDGVIVSKVFHLEPFQNIFTQLFYVPEKHRSTDHRDVPTSKRRTCS